MKVAIYARTSTNNQQKGLESQIRALESYCESKGIKNFKFGCQNSGAKFGCQNSGAMHSVPCPKCMALLAHSVPCPKCMALLVHGTSCGISPKLFKLGDSHKVRIIILSGSGQTCAKKVLSAEITQLDAYPGYRPGAKIFLGSNAALSFFPVDSSVAGILSMD